MEEKKKNKEKKFDVKELFTNRQYRSIIILVFYIILFAIIISASRNGSIRGSNNSGNTNYKVYEGYELINNKNFAYKYSIVMDDRIIYYEGKKNGNNEIFIVSENDNQREYYIEGKTTFIKDNDSYYKDAKPYFILDFFDTSLVEAIIRRGVVTDSSNIIEVDNQNVYDVLSDRSSKVDDGINKITLVYKNSYITGITMDLSNYVKVLGDNYDKVIISLEYYDFNVIEDIKR